MDKIVRYSVLIVVICLTSSCLSSKFCKENKSLIKRVNVVKSFSLKSKYCIESVFKNENKTSEIILNIFDGVSGKPLDGIVFFTTLNSTKKLNFSKGTIRTKLPPGDYTIEITATGENSRYSIPFTTKKIELPISSIVKINCFIGGIRE